MRSISVVFMTKTSLQTHKYVEQKPGWHWNRLMVGNLDCHSQKIEKWVGLKILQTCLNWPLWPN